MSEANTLGCRGAWLEWRRWRRRFGTVRIVLPRHSALHAILSIGKSIGAISKAPAPPRDASAPALALLDRDAAVACVAVVGIMPPDQFQKALKQ